MWKERIKKEFPEEWLCVETKPHCRRKEWMNVVHSKIISQSCLYKGIMIDNLGEVVGSLVGQNPGVAISADQ